MTKNPLAPLSLDDFIAADGVEYAEVQVRGGVVRIGSISGEDFVAWQELRDSGGPEGRKNASSLLLLRSLVDADGKRIGISSDAKVEAIKKMNLKTTESVLKAIFKLNGINQRDDAKNA